MKKVILVLILVTSTYALKAQQTLKLMPADSLSNKFFDKYLKVIPKDQLQWLKPQLNIGETLSDINTNTIFKESDFYDRMPIVKLDGRDNMPVAKLEGYDNMPVKQTASVNPVLPALKTP